MGGTVFEFSFWHERARLKPGDPGFARISDAVLVVFIVFLSWRARSTLEA
jgi:hypothetical protein